MRVWPLMVLATGSLVPIAAHAALQADAGGHGHWGDHGHQPQQVFISPAGEAFRAPLGAPYPVAAWFAEADLNHDGRLDRNEFEQDFKRFFDQLDVGHQGELTGLDIQRYESQVVPEVAARGDVGGGAGGGFHGQSGGQGGGGQGGGGRGGWGGGGRGGGGGGGGHHGHRGGDAEQSSGDADHSDASYDIAGIGAARYSLIAIPEPVASMDTNMDGNVTPDEVEAAADRRFDELDQNSQGYLTLKTLPETPAERHHEHGHHGKHNKHRPDDGADNE